MNKKPILERLRLTNGGRASYLEFLRNLTPQVLLFTLSILCMNKLDPSRIDLSNYLPTIITFIFIGSFVLAFWANSTLFFENCFGDLNQWSKDKDVQLKNQQITGLERYIAKAKAAWSEQRIEWLEAFVALVFLQFALAAVIIMSVNSAYGILTMIHPR